MVIIPHRSNDSLDPKTAKYELTLFLTILNMIQHTICNVTDKYMSLTNEATRY